MADLALLALMAAGFILGFFRGAVRQLLAVGAWVVAFLIAAQGRSVVGDWLAAQWTQFSRPYVDMLSFAILFVAMFVIGVGAVQFTGTRTTLTRQERLDDLAGGVLGVVLVLLAAASMYIILATMYAQPSLTIGLDVRWLRDLHTALAQSATVGVLRETLIPAVGAIFGALLPSDVRAVMG
jgi:membrane protein required for colicin V production